MTVGPAIFIQNSGLRNDDGVCLSNLFKAVGADCRLGGGQIKSVSHIHTKRIQLCTLVYL